MYLNLKNTLLAENADHHLSSQQVVIFAGGGSRLSAGAAD